MSTPEDVDPMTTIAKASPYATAPISPAPPANETDGTPYSEYKQTEEKASSSVFKIWTPDEIWKPLEPPDYLMAGLLVRGSLALIVAYGSSLKTWVLEDAALAVATGALWLQRFATTKGEALIIDFESGDYELRRRAHLIAKGREFKIPIEGFGFVTMPGTSLVNDEFFTALRPLAERYAFIGIDSLSAASGGIDENDARFATSLNRLKAIAAQTGCVIVVLHHSRKGNNNGDESDPRETVRGTSAIFNAADVLMVMSRGKDDAFITRQIKARGGKLVDPFVVRVDDVGPDAVVVAASDVPSEESDGNGQGKAIEKAKRQILVLLARETDLRTKDEIYARINGTKTVRIAALKELTDPVRGLVVLTDAGAYRLASEVGQ